MSLDQSTWYNDLVTNFIYVKTNRKREQWLVEKIKSQPLFRQHVLSVVKQP